MITKPSDERPNSPNTPQKPVIAQLQATGKQKTPQKPVIAQLQATGKQKIKNETSWTNSSRSYVCDERKSINGCIHTCDNYQQMKDCAVAHEQIVGVPAGDKV